PTGRGCRVSPRCRITAAGTSCGSSPRPTPSRCWPHFWRGAASPTSSSRGRRCTASSSASRGPPRRETRLSKDCGVAPRAYVAAVRTKAFLVSLVLLPILMSGGAIAEKLLRNQVDPRPRRFAVVDRTPGTAFATLVTEAARMHNELRQSNKDLARLPAFQV